MYTQHSNHKIRTASLLSTCCHGTTAGSPVLADDYDVSTAA